MKTKLFLILCVATLYSVAQISGTLDLTFGGTGYITTNYSGSDDVGNAMVVQTDGKIIVSGTSGSDFAISRYNTNGTLDATFGTGGKVVTSIGIYSDGSNSVKVQSDGKIIVVGYSINAAGTNNDFAIVRYTSLGVLDNTFGTGGIVRSSIGTGSLAYSLFIQSNGKIVVSGISFNGTYQSFAVARYNSNGTIDNTFGTSGQVITHVGSGNDFPVCMAQQSDGKIVVAGYTDNASNIDIAVVRYDSLGSIDNAFGTSGIVITPIGSGADIANAMALQPDGKIVVAGWSYNGSSEDFAVVRYDNTGILDPLFGTTGIVTTSISSFADGARGIVIQPNGKIVVAGFSRNSSNTLNNIAIVNYNNDGTLNNFFGSSGTVTTSIGSSHSDANAIDLQTDGKILIAGRSFNGTNNDFAVARFNNDITTNIDEIKYKSMVSISPNPFNSNTTISFNEEQKNSTIKIIDMNGKEVKTINFSGKQLVVEKGTLPPAVYFLVITSGSENVMNRKIVIQ
jgi:uncharacterized delta-60 repeat protein